MTSFDKSPQIEAVGLLVDIGLAHELANFENLVRRYQPDKHYRQIQNQVNDLLIIYRRFSKRLSQSICSYEQSQDLLKETVIALKRDGHFYDNKHVVSIARLAIEGLDLSKPNTKSAQEALSTQYKNASRNIKPTKGRTQNTALMFLVNNLCQHYKTYFSCWPIVYLVDSLPTAEYCGSGYEFALEAALLMYGGKLPIGKRTFGDYLLAEIKRLQLIQ